ncbi:MAG: LysM peptidoglycan-binding domain-containing protein [Deltaproteobacteria bacterium]|nr:LysM peptidoglycan-binding domain-containing protein [Deltaproteobacteria bacterium]
MKIISLEIKGAAIVFFGLLLGLTFLFSGCAALNGRPDATAPLPGMKSRASQPVDSNTRLAPVSLPPSSEEIEFLPLIPLEEATAETGTPDTSATETVTRAEDAVESAPESTGGMYIQSKFDKSLEFYQSSQDFWQKGDMDNALDSLDKAYALITDANTSDDPKYIQQKDDLRFMISKRILEIYASRYTTVKGNHNAIPLVENSHVEKELKALTEGNSRKFFINSYKRSGRYRPFILEELKKAGLPPELSWLPLIESGFKIRALSNARALGLWQFIASTGYKYGLKRDRYVDERLDPYKATKAAIEYLKELHEIFGDWETVLAAYNCGEGRVLRVIRNQNVNYLDDFWDLYQRLPYETARYVPKFLATLQIVKNLDKYGMADIEVDPAITFAEVKLDRQASIKDIAKTCGINEQKLLDLNPELRYKVLPNHEYMLKLPPESQAIVLAKIDKIPEYYQSPNNIVYHRVRPGETLSTIARRYHTTSRKIAWYNNIFRKNYIVAGQLLKIPQTGVFAARGKIALPPKISTYRVRRGDSLWVLAKRYQTTTGRIKKLNNLKSVNLHIGQKLLIPGRNSQRLNIYRVKQGDSPFTIAKKHNMDLDRLLRLNHLSNKSRIYPGQTLFVE